MRKNLKFILVISVLVFFVISCRNLGDLIPSSGSVLLNILTYNIHIGKGMDKKLDIPRIADVINSCNPDIVSLQEVDRNVPRSSRIDEFEDLKKLTKMDGVYGKTIDLQGGEFGIAVLTKLKIVSSEFRQHPAYKNNEQRGYLTLVLEKDGKTFTIIGTHLGWQQAEERKMQVEELLMAKTNVLTPLIIAGDFNEHPDTENWQIMNKEFIDAAQSINNAQPTFDASNPKRRIDYVWLDRKNPWRVTDCHTIKSLASDHLPLFCKLRLVF